MPALQVTRTVTVELDQEIVGIGQLEAAAVEFARTAPGQLVGTAIEQMLAELITTVIGPFGDPLPHDRQLEAPWACTGCDSRRGFRRRGAASKPRTLVGACGPVRFRNPCVQCQTCGRRFAVAGQVLGLDAYQRRTPELSRMAQDLPVRSPTPRPAGCWPRSPASTCQHAPSAVTCWPWPPTGSPRPGRCGCRLLLDGTGERAGAAKGGVQLHVAIGLIARRRAGRRVIVQAQLLAATLDEPWTAMDALLADVTPDLVVVDGEEALSQLAGRL